MTMLRIPRPMWVGLFTCFLIGVIGGIDFLTGPDFGFFVFYFLPVGYAAWALGRIPGTVASVISALVWLFVDMAESEAIPPLPMELWNAAVRLLAFLAFALTFARVRELLEVERELTRRLQASLEQVRELRGLLPICASCKRIRDDKGYWQQIENYISSHSRAEFTHGICPECARRLYPEVFAGDQEEEKHPEETPANNGSAKE